MDTLNTGVMAGVADLRSSDTGNPESSGEQLHDVADTESAYGVEDANAAGSQSGVDAPGAAAPGELSDIEFDEYIDKIMEGGLEQEEKPIKSESVGKPDNAAEPEANNEPVAKAEPFKTFESAEEYQAEIDRIFSKRHKNYKSVEAEHDSLISSLKEFYDVDDAKEAVQMFRNQMTARKAEELGMSTDEYEERREQRVKAEAYDAMMNAEKERTGKIEALRAELNRVEADIKSVDPDFDLRMVYNKDSEFKKDLNSTGSVFAAYLKLKARRNRATENSTVTQRQSAGFVEEGAKSHKAGRVASSAANMSDEDFEAYIRGIMNE